MQTAAMGTKVVLVWVVRWGEGVKKRRWAKGKNHDKPKILQRKFERGEDSVVNPKREISERRKNLPV